MDIQTLLEARESSSHKHLNVKEKSNADHFQLNSSFTSTGVSIHSNSTLFNNLTHQNSSKSQKSLIEFNNYQKKVIIHVYDEGKNGTMFFIFYL